LRQRVQAWHQESSTDKLNAKKKHLIDKITEKILENIDYAREDEGVRKIARIEVERIIGNKEKIRAEDIQSVEREVAAKVQEKGLSRSTLGL
jgi:hypothetical protein